MKHEELLKKYWGHETFREKQQEIIETICKGQDTLAILPTGAGKSVCYQIPAIVSNGLTIVVSPLIALMEDQVNGLRRRGIRSAALMGNLTRHEVLYILEQAEFGAYDLLYLSPERLMSAIFRKRLPFLNITLIAVDEAHCISQWGYDFRPHYLRIQELREHCPNAPIIALTASATTKVIDDICDKLHLNNPSIIKGDFSRSNLAYLVRKVEDKKDKLLEIIRRLNGSCIVYVRYREHCHKWVEELSKEGIDALPYHAGMFNSERKKNQEMWMNNQKQVIVATSAFGMGVDKPDVRAVIHLEMPDSLEAYYQEAGRAGRDGKKAYAVLLEEEEDERKLLKRMKQNFPPREYIAKVYQDLANYFVVGVLSGGGSVFPFNIIEFSKTCKHYGPSAIAAIKLLEMGDYLTLLEEMENPSKLRIITSRESLYSYRYPNIICERIIETVLRMYTGVLTDAVHINEDTIATKLNLTRETVYSSLALLSKCDIVKYIPFKKTPLLIYNQNRVPNEELYIPKSLYEERMERTENRAQSMLYYSHQEEICRERVLMQYFDVDNGIDCGNCDICRKSKKSKPIINSKFIKAACIEILKDKKLPAHQIVDFIEKNMNLSSNQKDIIAAEVRELIDNKTIHYDGLYLSLLSENN